MIIPVIPADLDNKFSTVNTLSPSAFTLLKNGCRYKKILLDSVFDKTNGMGDAILYPPNSAAIYGRIIHLMFEKRMKGLLPDNTSFEKAWDLEVEKINRDLIQKYPSFQLKNDYDKMFSAMNVAMNMVPTATVSGHSISQSSSNSLFERPYKIPGLLYGKIDRISYDNGKVEIIDYKTGNVYDESNHIKQLYIDQLNLYALMYEYVEDTPVTKLTIIDREGTEIDVPILNDKDRLKKEVRDVIENINSNVINGTANNLSSPTENNCKYCECRHLCSNYWVSPFFQNNILKGTVSDSGKKFISLTLDDGSFIRISGIDKLRIPLSEFYVGRKLMILEVLPSQQTIGQFFVTNNTLVLECPSTSDPYIVYYSNYLPELHTFVKIALDKGLNISPDGGFYILDDGVIIAEAGLGIESKKIVVDADPDSQRIFEERGYKVYSINDIDGFNNDLNN